MIWGPLASAALTGAIDFLGARAQNQAASAQAARQMAFQERMSNTAHQREVKDLRAAGLNPILSATGGSGSSTPSGAQAPVVSPTATAVSSAMQARALAAEIGLKQDQALAARAAAANSAASAARTEQLQHMLAPGAAFGDWTKKVMDFWSGHAKDWATSGLSSAKRLGEHVGSAAKRRVTVWSDNWAKWLKGE